MIEGEEEEEQKEKRRDREREMREEGRRCLKSPAQCREKMQEGKKRREVVRKDLLLGKGTVSFQAINKGTLWEHKEEAQMRNQRVN